MVLNTDSSMTPVMLTPDQLTNTDTEILSMLRNGRVTAPYVAEQQNKSLEYVRSRLVRLMEHGHVDRIHDGLYELVDDPEPSEPTETNENTVNVDTEKIHGALSDILIAVDNKDREAAEDAASRIREAIQE